MSSFIPEDERVVTIEDAKELQLRQEHVLPLRRAPANIEGKGEITIRDLLRNSLRMRPDRIVVGECRAGEALDMLQAMNTGHDGSLTTIHSNSPRDTLSRIETMTMMAGFDLPIRAIREQMASALDLVVHLSRLRDGTRRVTHVTEVQGMEGDIITLQDIFLFDFGAGVDEEGRFKGILKPTGIRPHFSEKLALPGISFPASVFGAGAAPTTPGRSGSQPPMKRFRTSLCFGAPGCLGANAAPVFGAGTNLPPTLLVRSLDTTGWPRSPRRSSSPARRRRLRTSWWSASNGKVVTGAKTKRLADTPTPIGVVLVIDTSGSMNEPWPTRCGEGSGASFVSERGAKEQIAVVAFSDLARVVHGFSADDAATATVADLTASGETALWDAVSVAAGLFADRPDLQPNLLVLSDGGDTVSTQSGRIGARRRHRRARRGEHCRHPRSRARQRRVGKLAGQFHGRQTLTTDGAEGLGDLFASVRRSLTQQFEVTWRDAEAQTRRLHDLGERRGGDRQRQPPVR